MSMKVNSNPVPVNHKAPDYKQMYEELQLTHQLMLSQISHEIRNPVTLINSFLQLVEGHHPELAEDSCWHKVMENMDFLRELLTEFSSFNNSDKLHRKELNVYHLLQDILESVVPSFQELGICVTLNKETAVPTTLADSTKLRQVILNLLRNAKEAIGSNGSICCFLMSNGETITIRIRNNGPCIPKEYQKDLFEPFVTHKKDGTGLGLAICRRIITAHEGSISCISNEELGTEFSIVLPVK